MKRQGILKELLDFIWENKLWWMIPSAIILILVGILLVLAQTTPLSPFIYALF